MAKVVSMDTLNHLYNFLCGSKNEIILSYDEKYDKTPVNVLLDLANQMDDVALYELGARYRLGVDGVEIDYDKAMQYFFPVLKMKRHSRAANLIGKMIWDDAFGTENEKECEKWFILASSWGDGAASENLAAFYESKTLGEPNYEKSIYYHKLAINQGNTDSYEDLAFAYTFKAAGEEGELQAQDYKTAFDLFSYSYSIGMKKWGSYNLGRAFFFGNGVEKDVVKAKHYFIEAASLGLEEANYFAGLLVVYDENGVEQIAENYDTAMAYLESSAEVSKEYAYDRMGYYSDVMGKTKEAIIYYKNAIERGNNNSLERYKELISISGAVQTTINDASSLSIDQLLENYSEERPANSFLIAQAYHYGRNGAQINYSNAYQYYKIVIQKMLPDIGAAYYELGEMFQRGQGCPPNVKEAFANFEKAFEYGYPVGMNRIAECYRKGIDVAADPYMAEKIYLKSIERGDADAEASLGEMYIAGELGGERQLGKGYRMLESAFRKNPSNPVAFFHMAHLYYTGYEDDEISIEQDYDKAIPMMEVLADTGDINSAMFLADIYSNKENGRFDYEKAVHFSDIVYAEHIPVGEMLVAMLNLFPEYKDEPLYDSKKGVEAAKCYIFNPQTKDTNGSKESLLELICDYYRQFGNSSQYVRKECKYLHDNLENMHLRYLDDETMQKLKNALFFILCIEGYELLENPLFGIDNLVNMINETEEVFRRNAYLGNAGIESMGFLLNLIGEFHLGNNDLENARYFFDQASARGYDEATNHLAKFSVNFWGKLEYRE